MNVFLSESYVGSLIYSCFSTSIHFYLQCAAMSAMFKGIHASLWITTMKARNTFQR